jgi:hypothetical protein
VERLAENRTAKTVFKYVLQEKKSVGKPIYRWLDDVENNLKKVGVTGWRKRARDRDAWKLILKEAKVLLGP